MPHAAEAIDLEGLCRRIALGQPDREAESLLCRSFASRIRVYGLRHFGDLQAAEDLVQDVLVAVLEAVRAGRVEHPERLGAFVLGTCRMLVRDERRKRRRREDALERYIEEATAPPPAEPLIVDLDRLLRCMRKLPDREMQIVRLTFILHQPTEHIAESLGLQPGHVRVIRHRALLRVRDCVEGASS